METSTRQCPRNHCNPVFNKNSDCMECNRERASEWRLKNVERSRDNSRRWATQHPSAHFASYLKRVYRMALAEYASLLEAQHGVCAICGKSPRGMTPNKRRFVVDHDHTTGAIWGLLCGNCNVGIGHLAGVLLQAQTYLSRWTGEDLR